MGWSEHEGFTWIYCRSWTGILKFQVYHFQTHPWNNYQTTTGDIMFDDFCARHPRVLMFKIQRERNFSRRGWEATAKELGLQERTQQGCEIIELLFSNCPSRTFWPSKIAMKFENFFAKIAQDEFVFDEFWGSPNLKHAMPLTWRSSSNLGGRRNVEPFGSIWKDGWVAGKEEAAWW